MNYEYKIANGHHLIMVEGKAFIIDTGSPTSFSMEEGLNSVQMNGRAFRLASTGMLDRAEVEALVGQTVHGLIGLDILMALGCICLDAENGIVCFEPKARTGKAIPIQVGNILGMKYLFMDVTVNHKPATVILDTGAKIGYFKADLLKELPVTGVVKDYNPILGAMSSDEKRPEIIFGGMKETVPVGVAPAALKLQLDMLGADGVMGICPFQKKCFRIDFNKGEAAIS